MLTTRTDSYASQEFEDKILRLARDPELNRQRNKTSQLVLLIQNFSVAERKFARLCHLSLKILQTLEKIELNLKNWEFLSLDINSANHFDASNSDEIKLFNTNVSVRILSSCQELTVKLNKLSADIDFITKALRTLAPFEYISDSGTLLTSLTLRSIRLKDKLRRKVTIAYLKATLITIGTDLEAMLSDGLDEQQATISSYRQFVVCLLGQLNQAVEDENEEDINECFAVISDMEQMFEAFKLETAQKFTKDLVVASKTRDEGFLTLDGSEFTINDDLTWTSQGSLPLYLRPVVPSITTPSSADEGNEHHSKGLVLSFGSNSILQRSTISEELPYLMSAFNLAKSLEEDMHHFKEKEEESAKEPVKNTGLQNSFGTPSKHFLNRSGIIGKTSLYSGSQFVQPLSLPGSYLYSNNSLISKMGIKPQVITTKIPGELVDNALNSCGVSNYLVSSTANNRSLEGKDSESEEDKENSVKLIPLTKENLATHNLTALTSSDIISDPDHDE